MRVLEKTHAATVEAYQWAKAKTSAVITIAGAAAASAVVPAHAALPAGITTAITDAGADMVTAITSIITAVSWSVPKVSVTASQRSISPSLNSAAVIASDA